MHGTRAACDFAVGNFERHSNTGTHDYDDDDDVEFGSDDEELEATKDARRAENEADDTERARMSVSAVAIIASIRCSKLRRDICNEMIGKV